MRDILHFINGKATRGTLVASALVLFVCLSNIAYATDKEYVSEEIEAHIRQVFAPYIKRPNSTLFKYDLKTLQMAVVIPDVNDQELMLIVGGGLHTPALFFGIPTTPSPRTLSENSIIIAISRDFNRALAHGLVSPIFNRSPAQDKRQIWEEAKTAVLQGKRREILEWIRTTPESGPPMIFGGAVISEAGYFQPKLSQEHKNQHYTRLLARTFLPYHARSRVYPDSVFFNIALKEPRTGGPMPDIDWALLRAVYSDDVPAFAKFSDVLPRIITNTKKQLKIRKAERVRNRVIDVPPFDFRVTQE